MNREQLRHAIRAAASAIGEPEVVVIGSQAILASIADERLPIEATRSIEADVMSKLGDPASADAIDALVGELSQFHETHGYYAQGVDLSTARLPDGWRERLVVLDSEFPVAHPILGSSVRGWCLEAHDLWASKIVAGREKDLEFCGALMRAGIVDGQLAHARVEMVPSVTEVERARARRVAGS